MQQIAVTFVQRFPQKMMRAFNAMLKLHDHCMLAAFDVLAFPILQVVLIMLTLLLAHRYAVEH